MQPDFATIPAELRAVPRWVVWKGAKVPFNPMLVSSPASVTDPDTWAPFAQAQTAYEEGGYSGVGFVLNGDGIVGVDLDKCADAGVPSPGALDLLDRIGCQYVEISPSGTGLRGFGKGDNIGGRRGKLDGINVELYSTNRYLTVTGKAIKHGPLVPLSGFAEAATAIRPPAPTEEVQKISEEILGSLLSSSVGMPSTCLPTSEGERHRCIFDLARFLKGTRPDASRDDLRATVQHWHRLALPAIRTKEFSTTWTDFLRGWDRVKQPHGATLNTIIQSIDFDTPLPTGIAALGYGSAGNRLVLICAALQSHEGDAPFFISARQAGELIGLHFTDASKVLSAMCMDGVLELVKRGAGKVASRYRFVWTTTTNA